MVIASLLTPFPFTIGFHRNALLPWDSRVNLYEERLPSRGLSSNGTQLVRISTLQQQAYVIGESDFYYPNLFREYLAPFFELSMGVETTWNTSAVWHEPVHEGHNFGLHTQFRDLTFRVSPELWSQQWRPLKTARRSSPHGCGAGMHTVLKSWSRGRSSSPAVKPQAIHGNKAQFIHLPSHDNH